MNPSQFPKISGFTLVRNGSQFDYPYLESIQSLLPLVDELVINVGHGDDDTLARIQELQKKEPKIQIFQSDWQLHNPEKKKGGKILSEQTNLALDRCTGDWCIYLQADEVLSEKDQEALRRSLQKAHLRPEVEGLLFDYVHFYGSYHVIQSSRSVYRREVRAVRRNPKTRSIGDAQSFRHVDGSKLQVIHSGARIFHYGWVRTPEAMKEKTFFMDQLYHGAPTHADQATRTPHTGDNYRYKKFWGLKPFQGEHPQVMKDRIRTRGWNWDISVSPMVFSWRDLKRVVLDTLERVTGYRAFEYRSYRLIR